MMIGVYDTRRVDRQNALRQAEKTFTEVGVTYYRDVCHELRQGASDKRGVGVGRQLDKAVQIGALETKSGVEPPAADSKEAYARRRQRRLVFLARKFTFDAGGIRPPMHDLCALEQMRRSTLANGLEPVVVMLPCAPSAVSAHTDETAASILAASSGALSRRETSTSEGRCSATSSARRLSVDFEVTTGTSVYV